MTSKAWAQRIHSRRRFGQRYGGTLTPELSAIIVRRIRRNLAVLVEKQSNRTSVWDVTLHAHECAESHPHLVGRAVRVVYDSKRKNLVTILPTGPKPDPAKGDSDAPPASGL